MEIIYCMIWRVTEENTQQILDNMECVAGREIRYSLFDENAISFIQLEE